MTFVLALIMVAVGSTMALADPLPQPRIDFMVKGDAGQGFTFVYRHHDGKLRIEQKMPGVPPDSAAIVNLATGKAVVSTGGGLAIELSADALPFKLNPGALDGKRTGSANVAGEACDVWEVAVPAARVADTSVAPSKVIYCITRDGIALRAEFARPSDGRPFVMAVSEVARVAQDPKLFEPPAGVPVTKASELIKRLPGGLLGKVLSNH
jgi:hypothetical protein